MKEDEGRSKTNDEVIRLWTIQYTTQTNLVFGFFIEHKQTFPCRAV